MPTPLVHVSSRQKELPLKDQKKKIVQIATCVLESENHTCEELSIFFITERAMCKMHQDFFQDPSPTDCISFPIEKDGYLGDIFVCPAAAKRYVDKHGGDIGRETTLYIVHGLLHLLGYDDIESRDRQLMRRKEKKCMDLLEKQQLILIATKGATRAEMQC